MPAKNITDTEVLVLGGGISGLIASIMAAKSGAEQVLVVDKAKAGRSGCSHFGAGVFRTYIREEDNFDAIRNELVMVNQDIIDQEWNNLFIESIHDLVVEMDHWGVEWEKTPEGKYNRVMIRFGSPERPLKALMFHGPQLMITLRKKALEMGVKIKDRVMITDLISDGNKVSGAVGFNVRNGEFEVFRGKATILTTGGTAYKSAFSGHKMQSGEAQAMLYRAGGELMNFDLCGQHVSCAEFDMAGMSMFVGQGGRFVNSLDEEFVHEYDPIFKDRTSLYTLAGAMAMEVKGGRGPIYLDMTHFNPEQVARLRRVTPFYSKILEKAGAMGGDKITRKLEWVATNFGTLCTGGGAKIDLHCKTSLKGLFASGDATSKVAISPAQSGPLPWAAVTGSIAGASAARHAREEDLSNLETDQIQDLKNFVLQPLNRQDGILPSHIIIKIQEVVTPYDVSVIKSDISLRKALNSIKTIRDEELPWLFAYDPHYLMLANETRSMVLNAEMWLRSCLLRTESRGTLMRTDHPYVDNDNWLKWVILRNESGSMKIWTEDLPIDRYAIKPAPGKRLHQVFEGANRRGIIWE
jgi:succinate dehydrogenase/fumarate reductase flavoprotein subunit